MEIFGMAFGGWGVGFVGSHGDDYFLWEFLGDLLKF
jgi:hypothetical protein